jgi:hypothetical protein
MGKRFKIMDLRLPLDIDTRIHNSKKEYDRNKNKEIIRKELEEYYYGDDD